MTIESEVKCQKRTANNFKQNSRNPGSANWVSPENKSAVLPIEISCCNISLTVAQGKKLQMLGSLFLWII
jgi:hypothetical protein